jgi:putative proteasome-type protease
MTYGVGMSLKKGLVFMSDTRTNAGMDNIASFRKLFRWEKPGNRAMVLLASGNLATTQSVVALIEERISSTETDNQSIMNAPTMFHATRLVAEILRQVVSYHTKGQQAESTFGASLIFGGQIAGGMPQVFLIYPEGNFIETSTDTPFFQVGETKYGKPILVRAYHPELSFAEAVKLLLVSFDSTVKANLSVSAPFDLQIIEADQFRLGYGTRIKADNPYFQTISRSWGEALKNAMNSIPPYHFENPASP